MSVYIFEEHEEYDAVGGRVRSVTFRPAVNLDEVLQEMSKSYKREFPSGIKGRFVPAADMTFKWVRWEEGDPGIVIDVPDYLKDNLDLAESMIGSILRYVTHESYSIWYSDETKGYLGLEKFILAHQPTCLERMSVRGAAGDVFDLDEIYQDLVRRGEAAPDKYVVFGWDDSDGRDRDTPFAISQTFHVITIPDFFDQDGVPKKVVEFMMWDALRRLSAGPWKDPEPADVPTRLQIGVSQLYAMCEIYDEEDEE